MREFIRETIERQHTTVINELSGMEGRLVTVENKVMLLLLGHEHLTVSENGWPLKLYLIGKSISQFIYRPFQMTPSHRGKNYQTMAKTLHLLGMLLFVLFFYWV